MKPDRRQKIDYKALYINARDLMKTIANLMTKFKEHWLPLPIANEIDEIFELSHNHISSENKILDYRVQYGSVMNDMIQILDDLFEVQMLSGHLIKQINYDPEPFRSYMYQLIGVDKIPKGKEELPKLLDFILNYLIDETKKLVNISMYHYQPFKEEYFELDPLKIAKCTEEKTIYESSIEDFLFNHPETIEIGLKSLHRQFDTYSAGIIDIIARDKNGNIVVIELKRDKGKDRVIGQIGRYLSWAEETFSSPVRGIIICKESDKKLQYSVKSLKYQVDIKTFDERYPIISHVKYCQSCGTPNHKSAKYCKKCGNKFGIV